ncbi:MAG: hypothetical protein JNM56_40290 [Planctomycetia bacterium]|nr:hypothetical protein [Planctomycetia bacterium]
MIASLPDTERLLTDLGPLTPTTLRTLGLQTRDLPADLAAAEGSGGRIALTAACWDVGPAGAPFAQCRFVQILGTTLEIVNVMIFPANPESMPVFAAELLVTGGCPRLAFVDLQAPGLRPARRATLGVATSRLAERYAALPAPAATPAWAVEFSPGGYVFTRPHGADCGPALLQLSEDYLQLWCHCAARWGAPGLPTRPESVEQLCRFKQHHIEHSPGRDYLSKVFGAEWTHRFLHDFLYR